MQCRIYIITVYCYCITVFCPSWKCVNADCIIAIANVFSVMCVHVCVVSVLVCQWPYGDICGIGPVGKGQGTEFNLTFRKGSGKKSETLKFSTEHRTELLTEALVRRNSCIASLPSFVTTEQSSCTYV